MNHQAKTRISMRLCLISCIVPLTVYSQELLRNGSFSQGWEGWTAHAHAHCSGARSAEIIPSDPPFEMVLQAESHEPYPCGSSSGASQALDIDVSSFSSLTLSADVKAISASVMNGCGVVGQEFPIRLDIEYLDAATQVHYLDFGFYIGGWSCGSPSPNPDWIFNTLSVPEDEWFHFVSPNLKNWIPNGSRITRLYVQGNGWAYVGRADNVRLTGCRGTSETTLLATPGRLWPPNHKLVPVSIQANTTGGCGSVSCKIVSVNSSEPLDPDGDWLITGDLSLLLRAERNGLGAGRIYGVDVRCTDVTGSATKTVGVTVPHDQRP